MTNQNSDDVSMVDLATGATHALLPVGGKPAGIALSPDGRRAYVTSPEGAYVSVIDMERRRAESRITLSGGPLGIAVNPVMGTIYVADWYEDRLFVVTPDGRLTATVATGDSPWGVAVSPDGGLLLTAERDDDRISLFDAGSLAPLGTIAVGSRSLGVTIDRTGARAYTANVGSNDGSVVDLGAR